MQIELLLAILQNLSGFCGFFAFVGALAMLISYGIYCAFVADTAKKRRKQQVDDAAESDEGAAIAFGIFKLATAITIPCALITAIPSVDQMFKIRIALIKYELASPENVQKVGSQISEIAKQLECKYLACPKEEKNK